MLWLWHVVYYTHLVMGKEPTTSVFLSTSPTAQLLTLIIYHSQIVACEKILWYRARMGQKISAMRGE